jgi:hypothetical protein
VFAVGVAIAAGITLFLGLSREPRPPASSIPPATPATRGAEARRVLSTPPPALASSESALSGAPTDGIAAPKASAPGSLDEAALSPAPRLPPDAGPRRPLAPPDAPSSTGSEAPHASPSSSAGVTGGLLRITADPAAGVSLQGPSGARALTTPVRDLKLPAGVYVLTFRSQTYPEPVVARVALRAGETRSVHVDFRDVEPRVIVR